MGGVDQGQSDLLKGTYSLDILSKYRNALFGIAIIWIMLFHGKMFGIYFGFLGKENLVNQLILFGNSGVDIFLFLSGMGLYYSFSKNQNPSSFMKRRLLRVLPPTLLISGVFWFVRWVIINDNLSGFLQRITLLRFWLKGDTAVWFVSFILVLYLFYPYIFHFLFDKGNAFWRCLTAITCALIFNGILLYAYPAFYNNVEVALTRVPLFLFSCYFGKLVYEKRRISGLWSILFVGGFIALFLTASYGGVEKPLVRYMLGVAGICLTFSFALFFELLRKSFIQKSLLRFFGFFGAISLELYLAHIVMRSIYRKYYLFDGGRLSGYFLFVLIGIVVAMSVHYITNKVPSLIDWVQGRFRGMRPKKAA